MIKSIFLRVVIFTAVFVTGVSSVSAKDGDALAYDIYFHNSCLTVWLDISNCLTSSAMEQLGDGIDLILECHTELITPRRFIGSRVVFEKTEPLRVTYERLTKVYVITQTDKELTERARFSSMADLFRFMRDSVEICLTPVDSLDDERRYRLNALVTAISLTDLNLTTDGNSDETGQSLVKYLFERFLDFTSYGRREYQVTSDLFPLKELESVP